MSTETTTDPAKLRQGARDELAALRVAHGVIDDLSAIVDERWCEIYARQARLREIFKRLEADLGDFQFDSDVDGDILLAKLDELDAAAKAAEAEVTR
jgi:hypothetical protein